MKLKGMAWVPAAVVVAALAGVTVSSRGQSRPGSLDQVPEAGRIGGDLRAGYHALAGLFAGTAGTTKELPDQKKRRLQAIFDQVRALDALLPKDTFDLKTVAAQVGRQPDRLHKWVRQQTMWVPYRGTLRGAQGTLIDRKGNSLDRALLLAGLLAAADVPVRLAHADLTDDTVTALKRARLAASKDVTKATEPANAGRSVLATIDTFAKQTSGDAGLIQRELVRTLELARTASNNVRRRVDVQSARLVKDLGITAPGTGGNESTPEIESLKDHWWVQWQNGADWADLDPDLADAGAAIAPAESTLDVDALPADVHHVVQVRVIAEKWTGSALEQQQVVSVEVVPSEVIGESIRLQHVPMAWPTSLDGPASALQQRFKAAALSQHEWLPVLTIGNRRVIGASITDTGDLNSNPGSKPPAAAAAVGAFIDAFGGGEPPSPGVLTSEWIEYEIRTPGREPRIIRREVFDILGPSARAEGRGPQTLTDPVRLSRAFGLLTETEMLPLPCQLSSAFVQHLTAARILAAEPILTDFSDGRAKPDQLANIVPLPGLLYDFAVARGDVSKNPGTVYLQSINLLSRHTFPVVAADGTANFATAMDIVANEVASTAAAPAEQFRARLEQGVLDTNLEAVFIGPAARGGAMADLFGGDPGRKWIAVGTAADLDKLAVPPDIRARIDADLSAGYTVLAVAAGPADPVGWWRVDPRTGDTLGLGNRGWGQAMVEYKLIAASVATFSICSVGAYVANGAYTARDRVICALAGLTTMFGGAAITTVPMFGGGMSYAAIITDASLTIMPGMAITAVTATLFAVLADALGLGW